MAKLQRKQLNSIQKSQLKKLGVSVVYLFGSFAERVATPLSDVDIGIVFKNPKRHAKNTLPAYNLLYRIFSDLFPKGPNIDVVFLQFAPMTIQAKAAQKGELLYADSPAAHFQYREETMRRRADLQFFIHRHSATILERI